MSTWLPAHRPNDQRAALLSGVVLAGFALVVFGLLRLQVAEHDSWRRLAEENRVRPEVLRAPRGAILDRNGEMLADNAPSFTIVFRPMPAESTRVRRGIDSAWLRQVSALVELDTTEVRQRVAAAKRTGQSAVLRRTAPPRVLAGVEESRGELPGIEVQMEPLRRYPHGTMAAHLLGYAGEINEVELDSLNAQGYRLGDLIGRNGVERSYEEQLRGLDGAELVVVNAMGQRVSTLSEGPPRLPVAGHDLVLTLDLKIQLALEDAMSGVERGAAVALDPRDGGILALVSRPAFDPNEFSMGLSRERWAELFEGDANPLLNRAVQAAYPPGSTFKVVSMLGALRYGLLRPESHQPVACFGSYTFGGRRFACWNHNGHGSLDLIAALQNSCDVYFYQIGPRLGLPRLEATARDLGLGDRTGVDLPYERRGLIPSPGYYDQRWGAGKWRNGLLLNLAIGQGELLVTPLQLATMMAAVVNDGRPIRPHLVQQVRGIPEFRPARPSGGGPEVAEESWKALHKALELVVSAGTGTAARVPGISVAGKTGTAQNPHGKDHALFVCYAPADHPTIVMAVVAENSGHGGSVAAPIAGSVLRALFASDSSGRVVPPAIVRARAAGADTSGARDAD